MPYILQLLIVEEAFVVVVVVVVVAVVVVVFSCCYATIIHLFVCSLSLKNLLFDNSLETFIEIHSFGNYRTSAVHNTFVVTTEEDPLFFCVESTNESLGKLCTFDFDSTFQEFDMAQIPDFNNVWTALGKFVNR